MNKSIVHTKHNLETPDPKPQKGGSYTLRDTTSGWFCMKFYSQNWLPLFLALD
jgi:hypothetical protein